MKNDNSGQSNIVSRAVEEPLEATFELGEKIKNISNQLSRPVIYGLIGTLIFLILLLPSLYNLIVFLIDGLLGELNITTWDLIRVSILGLVLILLFAIVISILIYLSQIKKFNEYLIQRYSVVTGLKDAQISDSGKSTKESKRKSKSDSKIRKTTIKHVKNPIFATLDLVEESMHELPQLIRLLNICKYFIIVLLVYLALSLIIKFTINQNLLFSITIIELFLGFIVFVLLIPTVVFLIETVNLFKYIQARHEIIDSVRFEKDLAVPTGSNPMQKMINYIFNDDPYLKRLDITKMGKIENVNVIGSSGKEYEFDVYFTFPNELSHLSARLGLPKGRFSVFIKVFKKPINLRSIQQYQKAVADICEANDTFPLRIIAYQWQVEELADEVYEFVLEKPVIIKKSMTHIQIVAEDGEIYSFIPLISYGKEI